MGAASVNPEFGATVARGLNQSRVSAVLQSNPTEAIRDNPKIFTKSEKNIFKIRQHISNRNVFWKSSLKGLSNLKNYSQILIKVLNPEILFCKSQTSLQIQELSLNLEKYCTNPKKIFCYVLLAPAVSQRQSLFPPFCNHFAVSKMAEERVGKEFVIVYNVKDDVQP